MTEPKRILVNGAQGRMGSLASGLIRGAEGLRLVAETDRGDDLEGAIRDTHAEVVLDFTHHSIGMEIFRRVVEAGVRPVSGTSGFTESDIEAARLLLEAAGSGGMIVPNFSLGAVLMMRFAEEAARSLPHVEIVEMHHDRKGDAPSGTAELTARRVALARGTPPPPKVTETERMRGARGARVSGVPVHSLRLPGALAHQEVIFSGPGELLTIRHDSLSRESFGRGILLALEKVPFVSGLVHGLDALL